MISKHFKLNFKQHKMFISVGLKFIESIANDFDINFEFDSHSYFVNSQFIGFLAGGAAVNNSYFKPSIALINETRRLESLEVSDLFLK